MIDRNRNYYGSHQCFIRIVDVLITMGERKNEKGNDAQITQYNNIAVALQFRNRDQIDGLIKKVLNSRANIVEIRFDYSDDLIENLKKMNLHKNFNGSLNKFVKSAFPEQTIQFIRQMIKKPVIFTLRRKDQGGNCEIPENLRIDLIKYLMNFQPDYFDLEYDIEIEKLNELNTISKKLGVNIIFSYHNWKETPAIGKIKKLIDELIINCPEVLPEKKGEIKRNILKLVFTANNIADNNRVLEICKKYSQKGVKIVCFSMGLEGIPSRVRSLLYGAYLSYASLDGQNPSNATAPGQISLDEFFDYLNKE